MDATDPEWALNFAHTSGVSISDAIAALCLAAGGVLRTRALLEAGWSKRQISHAVSSGGICRVRRGVFRAASADPRVVQAALVGGSPACLTAAEVYGLWVVQHRGFHVAHGSSGHRHAQDSVYVHHWDDGPPVPVGVLPALPRVLVQIARCAGAEAFFVALESALSQRLLSVQDVSWIRLRIPPPMRELVDFARDDADSGLESIVRLRLRPHGIRITPQFSVDGVRRSDLLIGDRLLIEIDGKPHHEGEVRRHKDYVRDAEAALWDYETLRFDYSLVIHDWPLVEAAILAKVAAGAHLARNGPT